MISLLNIPQSRALLYYEADDIIGTYTKRFSCWEMEKLHHQRQDYCQLVNDHVRLF